MGPRSGKAHRVTQATRGIAAIVLALLITTPAEALLFQFNMGPNLLANPTAIAAFNTAAQVWESIFTDPVTVNIDAEIIPLAPNRVGQASVVFVNAPFNTVIAQLKAGADADDGILQYLPLDTQFSALGPLGFGLSDVIAGSKAEFKAMGFTDLDSSLYGANDATIRFNSNFAFDYDPSNGIDSDKEDFVATAVHELGHALGFISAEDRIDELLRDGATGVVNLEALDLFRFDPNGAPTTPAQFTTAQRDLFPPHAQVFTDTQNTWRMSTGTTFGDGQQASHWLDDRAIPPISSASWIQLRVSAKRTTTSPMLTFARSTSSDGTTSPPCRSPRRPCCSPWVSLSSAGSIAGRGPQGKSQHDGPDWARSCARVDRTDPAGHRPRNYFRITS